MGKVTKLRIGGYAAGLPEWFNAIGDELVESASVASVKLRNLTKSRIADAMA